VSRSTYRNKYEPATSAAYLEETCRTQAAIDGGFFLWALIFALRVTRAPAQVVTLATISDTVRRADGGYASGTLLISWPAFTTATGATVAAGNKGVTLGTNGSFAAQLAADAGATPAGTVYTVVYQLTDGTVKSEAWSVGTSLPETISQVRTLAGTPAPQS
jgi:hypothetical protein